MKIREKNDLRINISRDRRTMDHTMTNDRTQESCVYVLLNNTEVFATG